MVIRGSKRSARLQLTVVSGVPIISMSQLSIISRSGAAAARFLNLSVAHSSPRRAKDNNSTISSGVVWLMLRFQRFD